MNTWYVHFIFKGMNQKLKDSILVQSTQRALITLIPISFAGSITIILQSFPLPIYQEFLHNWNDGFLSSFFSLLYDATFGILSIYMICLLGYHYSLLRRQELKNATMLSSIIVSIASFAILANGSLNIGDALGVKGLFLAITATLIASSIYYKIDCLQKTHYFLADGSDVWLTTAIRSLIPVISTIILFGCITYSILFLFDAPNIYTLLTRMIEKPFTNLENGFGCGFLFVFISSFLWFLGIHGSNMLDNVSQKIFETATQTNIDLVNLGLLPTEIVNKQFLDAFVLMGGCGCSIGLVLAILFFGKRNSSKHIVKISFFPMIFNINEFLVFGLPIIYNPIFLIPFLLVPLVCYTITYFAMYIGLLPLVTNAVKWTTPIIFSGYLATNSYLGIIMQVVNISIAIAIYAPFVRIYDKERLRNATSDYKKMIMALQKSENTKIPITLTDSSSGYSWLAKSMTLDLNEALKKEDFILYYQPQFDITGNCIGAEALLRWTHPQFGNIYPPLIFKLATESNYLFTLEKWVVQRVIEEMEPYQELITKKNLKISLNITGTTIQQRDFEIYLRTLSKSHSIRQLGLCLEVTEQAALQLDDRLEQRFQNMKSYGFHLAVDDFSMGNTSLQYLIKDYFDLVKIDGGLVQNICTNKRCKDIISSIIQLSQSLEFQVIAEYVSTADIRNELADIGCYNYQGWFYSTAIPLEEFEMILKKGL